MPDYYFRELLSLQRNRSIRFQMDSDEIAICSASWQPSLLINESINAFQSKTDCWLMWGMVCIKSGLNWSCTCPGEGESNFPEGCRGYEAVCLRLTLKSEECLGFADGLSMAWNARSVNHVSISGQKARNWRLCWDFASALQCPPPHPLLNLPPGGRERLLLR